MMIEIKSWHDGKVLFSGEFGSLKLAVEAAVSQGVSLSYASLVGASLVGARLDRASLVGARLDRARLDRAILVGASLDGASLDGASLVGARLDRARLDRAILVGASLVGASLDGASLDGASLVGARLDRASLVGASLDGASLDAKQLQMFRDDIWGVLSSAPAEVKGLLKALEDGKVDGSTYEGSCACLVGTIANVRGCKYDAVKGLSPNSSRPAEVWFMQIRKGDTPKTNKAAKQAHEWISQWLETMQGAFAGK